MVSKAAIRYCQHFLAMMMPLLSGFATTPLAAALKAVPVVKTCDSQGIKWWLRRMECCARSFH
jgi:hypothetical protein